MNHELESYEGELKALREELDSYKKLHADNCVAYDEAVADREHFRNLVRNYDTLDKENKDLRSKVALYDKIFLHSFTADKVGNVFFICGEGGEKDKNNLPEQIHICPAYGCDWFQVYERTDKTWGPEY